MGTANTPLIVASLAFLTVAIGWLVRELWLRREHKRQAVRDGGTILKEQKTHLEDMIAKTEDANQRQMLVARLDEVNAALMGFYAKRLRHTLEEAGFPAEEALIANGQRQLQPKQVADLRGVIEVVKTLPPLPSTLDLLILGNAYYHMQQYQDAKNIYDKILNLNPDHPAVLNNRGATYNDLKRYHEALADYNRCLELRPDDPGTLNNRGVTYDNLERYDEALADFNRSLELRPDDPTTLYNRGNTYAHLERYDDALADYNRSLELRPEHPATLTNRGASYTKLERYDDALADFNRSIEIRPDNAAALYDLACLFSLWGKTDDALVYLEKAIVLDKKNREDAKTDKDFDNIRDDPRFKKLMKSD